MEQEYLHVIGLGNAEDWQAGRGSIYFGDGKRCRLFDQPSKLNRFGCRRGGASVRRSFGVRFTKRGVAALLGSFVRLFALGGSATANQSCH